MSKYTTELRFIVESGFPLFTFEYPFYDEAKKEEFQSRFIKHFFFHEIGQETAEQFKHYLEIKFNEVLPYYNEMFRTAQIQYDPLLTIEFTEEYTRSTEGRSSAFGTGTQTTTENEDVSREALTEGEMSANGTEETSDVTNKDATTSTARTSKTEDNTTGTDGTNKAFSDTPQGRVFFDEVRGDYVSTLEHTTENTTRKVVHDGTETDNVTAAETNKVDHSGETSQEGTSKTESSETSTRSNRGNATTENTQTGNTSGTETYKKHSSGDMGVRPASYLLDEHLKYQRKIKTIELQFFEECNDLFMEIW